MTDERKARQEELRLKREKRTAWRLVHPGEPYRWYTDLTPEEKKRINRVEQLKESGWTMETFANAKEAQGGKCAICGDTPIPAAHCSEGLHADHKHVMPPMPRALLCPRCNSGIGQFLESPERCEAAAKYLRYWNMPLSPQSDSNAFSLGFLPSCRIEAPERLLGVRLAIAKGTCS